MLRQQRGNIIVTHIKGKEERKEEKNDAYAFAIKQANFPPSHKFILHPNEAYYTLHIKI